jgi:4-alpha-glucanotransferase
LQDLLNLGKEARMNVPGRAEGNWRWRRTQEMISDPAFEWVRGSTKSSNRLAMSETPNGEKAVEVVSR